MCIERMKMDPMYNKEDGLIHFPDSRFEDPAEYCEWADLQVDGDDTFKLREYTDKLNKCGLDHAFKPISNPVDGNIYHNNGKVIDKDLCKDFKPELLNPFKQPEGLF